MWIQINFHCFRARAFVVCGTVKMTDLYFMLDHRSVEASVCVFECLCDNAVGCYGNVRCGCEIMCRFHWMGT